MRTKTLAGLAHSAAAVGFAAFFGKGTTNSNQQLFVAVFFLNPEQILTVFAGLCMFFLYFEQLCF
ncbi:hypothetical protein [Flavisolibacter nicotianae]|uniref:hypothetical protein n=1 Tax=Flavisolibacter nicotianae TaxID=2364882 RepID=UPI0013C4D9E9|nr:hypothetical protein [Flavisolibacter nicotianae]